MEGLWIVARGDAPLVATAIHDGRALRPEVAECLALSGEDRLREEDPYTGILTKAAPNRVVARQSRFEVDLNRPRERAVYLHPEDAWGLSVWKERPDPKLVQRSLEEYDAFYATMRELFSGLERRFGHFVVLDLHSYNHRRSGPMAPPEDPEKNPAVNVGTGSLDRTRWGSVVERFMTDLRNFDFLGQQLDVRENVRFRGGHFPSWIHENFPRTGCAIAIEFKKFFMDEWTGKVDRLLLGQIEKALRSAVPGVLEELDRKRDG